MELIKAIAIAFHEDSFLKGKWPVGAESLYQTNTSEIEFDEEVELEHWSRSERELGSTYETNCLEVENMP